jgi:hypothetical protein
MRDLLVCLIAIGMIAGALWWLAEGKANQPLGSVAEVRGE